MNRLSRPVAFVRAQALDATRRIRSQFSFADADRFIQEDLSTVERSIVQLADATVRHPHTNPFVAQNLSDIKHALLSLGYAVRSEDRDKMIALCQRVQEIADRPSWYDE